MIDSTFMAQKDDSGRRLDRVVRKMLPGASLSWIYGAIRRGGIRLNEHRARPSAIVTTGDRILLRIRPPVAQPKGAAAASLRGNAGAARERLESLRLFENAHVLALNKPRGMLVSGPGSLAELVSAALAGSLPPSLSFRPGPLHRLDRNTSGVILFSRSLEGARIFSSLLRGRRVEKYYLALLTGALTETAVWRSYLARDFAARKTAPAAGTFGQYAETQVRPLISRTGLTLALCRILTGRTHQIRAQAARVGHPPAGDRKYGGEGRHRLLHALCLAIPFPGTLGFHALWAPLPAESAGELAGIFGEKEVSSALDELHSKLGGEE